MSSTETGYVELAIRMAYGDRCDGVGPYCPCCKAWAEYDTLVASYQHGVTDEREACARVAETCFGPADEKLTVGEGQGYDLAQGRIADAIRSRTQDTAEEAKNV